MLLRDTNEDCFNCGAQIPNEVRHREDGSFRWFVCPNCYEEIAAGIVQTDGEINESPVPIPVGIPPSAQRVEGPQSWTTAELWWTNDDEYVTLVNGRRIEGGREMASFIEKLFALL